MDVTKHSAGQHEEASDFGSWCSLHECGLSLDAGPGSCNRALTQGARASSSTLEGLRSRCRMGGLASSKACMPLATPRAIEVFSRQPRLPAPLQSRCTLWAGLHEQAYAVGWVRTITSVGLVGAGLVHARCFNMSR